MAKYGEHFSTIENMLLVVEERMTDKKVDFTINGDLTDPHLRRHNFILSNEDLMVRRTVVITEIDRTNHFDLTLEEARCNPDFIISTDTRRYDADSDSNMDFAIGQMMQFLQRDINPKRYPTEESIAHVSEINRRQFGDEYCEAQLYFVSDEYDDLWKIRLAHRLDPKEVYAKYLPLDISDQMCAIIHRTYHRGWYQGRTSAYTAIAERMACESAERVVKMAILRPHEIADNHPGLSDFINKGHLRHHPITKKDK